MVFVCAVRRSTELSNRNLNKKHNIPPSEICGLLQACATTMQNSKGQWKFHQPAALPHYRDGEGQEQLFYNSTQRMPEAAKAVSNNALKKGNLKGQGQ